VFFPLVIFIGQSASPDIGTAAFGVTQNLLSLGPLVASFSTLDFCSAIRDLSDKYNFCRARRR